MTYAVLIAIFGAVALVALLLARRRREPGAVRAMLVAFVGLAVLTIVFDSIMIASDLFSYGSDHISGLYLGLAPLEDLAYPAVALVVGVAVWSLMPPSRRVEDATPAEGEGRA